MRHEFGQSREQKVKIVLPNTVSCDEIGASSLRKFIIKFELMSMLIFDAILAEKRILFLGGRETPAEEIQEYVLACTQMVCPPLNGMLMKVFPYVCLEILEFKDEPGFIAGATNPVFKQHAEWYDVCCEIDIGKLKCPRSSQGFYNYDEEKYAELDRDFLRPIIDRIKNKSINDEEIRRCFESYTSMILDLALHEEGQYIRGDSYGGMTHKNASLQEILQPRIRRFRLTKLFEI